MGLHASLNQICMRYNQNDGASISEWTVEGKNQLYNVLQQEIYKENSSVAKYKEVLQHGIYDFFCKYISCQPNSNCQTVLICSAC